MKIRFLEEELFHASQKTHTMMLLVAFMNFANVPKHRCLAHYSSLQSVL